MQIPDHARPLKLALWRVDGSKVILGGIARIAAITILGLLITVVWMSFRTGVPGQPSSYRSVTTVCY